MLLSENKIFTYAVGVSLVIHVIFLAKVSGPAFARFRTSPIKRLEVTYKKVKTDTAKPETFKPTKSIQEKKLTKTPKALLKDDASMTTPLVKEMAKLDGKIKLDEKRTVKLETKPIQRNISVPELKSEKINNPVYLNYYQIVRNRIKERAYLNYSKTESGNVYLTFVLLADGSLKQVKLIEERSNANQYLRDVGLKSIQEASPFPIFPEDLKYPELSFNVVISFEIKEEEN